MVKKLVQHGDGVVLVIDKPVMKVLKITHETAFELSADGKDLSPQNENTREESVIHSLEKVNNKYGTVLKRLGE